MFLKVFNQAHQNISSLTSKIQLSMGNEFFIETNWYICKKKLL
jgi:hypothetical protein